MTWVSGDRVKETTTTTGTGTVTLAGAASGYRAFSAVAADTDIVAYTIAGTTEWEVGIGTWNTGGTLSRTKVLASSNSGALVSFSAGSKDVFCDFPASHGITALTLGSQSTDVLIPRSSSLVVPDEYEIASGKELELGVSAVLEIG